MLKLVRTLWRLLPPRLVTLVNQSTVSNVQFTKKIMLGYTIVSRTNYQDLKRQAEWEFFFPNYNKNSFSTRLRSNNDPLGEAVKTLEEKSEESELSLKLIHPQSANLSTVCIWKNKQQTNKYYVKDQEDLSTLDRLADRLEAKNLLYLPTLQGKKLIDFRDINNYNATYRYQVIEPEELGFPQSLASKKSAVNGAFFRQVKNDEGVAEEIIDIECEPKIIGDRQDRYYAAGWLNPLIFNLTLDENDIKYIQESKIIFDNSNIKTALQSLSLFIDPSAIILVEPHINESYDLRIIFLVKFNQILQQRQGVKINNENLSMIEYFILGSQYYQAWKPFLILDLLGGEFYAYQNISQNIESKNREPEKLVISWNVSWKPPKDAQSNKLWLADYWLKKWIKAEKENNQNQVDVVPSPSVARPYRYNQGLVTFGVDDLANLSLTSLLSQHPQFGFESNNLYFFLVEVFQTPEIKKSVEKFPYDNFWRIKNTKNQLIIFDDVDFCNYFSKNHVIPESPILIAIPQQNNRFLDPVRSINFGPYHFLWELFNCLNSDRQQKIMDFNNIFGWWNDWHSTIFNERWDIWLNFINKRGFIIQQSIVGRDYLGEKGIRIDWKDKNMRFSSISKNN